MIVQLRSFFKDVASICLAHEPYSRPKGVRMLASSGSWPLTFKACTAELLQAESL